MGMSGEDAEAFREANFEAKQIRALLKAGGVSTADIQNAERRGGLDIGVLRHFMPGADDIHFAFKRIGAYSITDLYLRPTKTEAWEAFNTAQKEASGASVVVVFSTKGMPDLAMHNMSALIPHTSLFLAFRVRDRLYFNAPWKEVVDAFSRFWGNRGPDV